MQVSGTADVHEDEEAPAASLHDTFALLLVTAAATVILATMALTLLAAAETDFYDGGRYGWRHCVRQWLYLLAAGLASLIVCLPVILRLSGSLGRIHLVGALAFACVLGNAISLQYRLTPWLWHGGYWVFFQTLAVLLVVSAAASARPRAPLRARWFGVWTVAIGLCVAGMSRPWPETVQCFLNSNAG